MGIEPDATFSHFTEKWSQIVPYEIRSQSIPNRKDDHRKISNEGRLPGVKNDPKLTNLVRIGQGSQSVL